MPFVEEIPKLAVDPVNDINTPIRTLSALLPPDWQAKDVNKLAKTTRLGMIRFIVSLTRDEDLNERKLRNMGAKQFADSALE
jgi:hypothetical protein